MGQGAKRQNTGVKNFKIFFAEVQYFFAEYVYMGERKNGDLCL